VFSDGASRLAVVTDLGTPTDHVAEKLSGCDALVLEANHDREMLEKGSYPRPLKVRVGGRWATWTTTRPRTSSRAWTDRA
jgi:hypothetical protein